MNSGTKVLLALSGLFIGLLILYYGFLSGGSDLPPATRDEALMVEDPTRAGREPVRPETPAVEMGGAIEGPAGPARSATSEPESAAPAAADPTALGPTPAWSPSPLRDAAGASAPDYATGTAAAPPGANDPVSVAAQGSAPASAEQSGTAGSPGALTPGSGRPALPLVMRPVAPHSSAVHPAAANPGAPNPGAAPSSSGSLPAGASRANSAQLETYTVVSGDTLSSIAAQRLGDANWWSEIARANPGVDPDHLRIGQRLLLPPKGAPAKRTVQPAAIARGAASYVVASGDTLSSIAFDVYGDRGAWKRLYEANRSLLDDPDALEVGMTLKVPR